MPNQYNWFILLIRFHILIYNIIQFTGDYGYYVKAVYISLD